MTLTLIALEKPTADFAAVFTKNAFPGAPVIVGRKRLNDAGLTMMTTGNQVQIAAVKFGTRAKKAGFEQGWDVKAISVPTDRANPHWFYLPAMLLAAWVWWVQGRRMRSSRLPQSSRA